MSSFLPISQIDSRREALGLEAKRLYDAAKVGRTTWHRAVAGSMGTRTGALVQLTDALLAEELRILAHLIALHPDAAAALLAGRDAGAADGAKQEVAA